MQKRLCLYYRQAPQADRFITGDRYLRSFLRKIIGRTRVGGIEKVFVNLCKGLTLLGVPYTVNLPYNELQDSDVVVVLGTGKFSLSGYQQKNKIIAGIGLMSHPAQWPNLFKEFPVRVYLQHSKWTQKIYNDYYGENSCLIWPAGIDTTYWKPAPVKKDIDVLIYSKFLWHTEEKHAEFLAPVMAHIQALGLKSEVITYGNYRSENYKKLLERSKCMVFLCEHESQGIAYQEALAMDIPIAAWDQGFWLDPNRFEWGEPAVVEASSVPYFDETCGIKFKDLAGFKNSFAVFFDQVKHHNYQPRNYILEHLTLEKSAGQMLEIIAQVK